ncbi:MAG: hypothetical protein AB7N73_06405 [Gemmatimonadales bacterium]
MIRRVLAALALLAAWGCDGAELGPFRLTPFAWLGADSGVAAIPTWPQVSARHPAGYRVVVPQPGSSGFAPLAFDDGGNFLGALDPGDRAAEGFERPLFARVAPDGTVWVFDAARRALVFDAARRYLRTVRLPVAPWDAAFLADGRIALTSSTFAAPQQWLLVDAAGRQVRSVGEATPGLPSPRRIVAGNGGEIWTVTMTHRFVIEAWDTAGRWLRRFDQAPEWFAPYDRLDAPGPDRPPQPAVQGIWLGAHGRLWVLGKVADPEWASGLGPVVNGTASILRPDDAFDTVLELRDPATGAVLAAARFDRLYPFAVEPGVAMRPLVIEGGWFRAELTEVVAITEGH